MENATLLPAEHAPEAVSLPDKINDLSEAVAVSDVPLNEKDIQVLVAPQWKLIWWRFRRHRLALISAIVTIFIYLVALFAEFLSPFDASAYNAVYTYAP